VSEVIVRPLETDVEADAFLGLAVRAFSRATDHDAEAIVWRDRCRAAPWHRPAQLRGAFRGRHLVGGYEIAERWLKVGRARLLTGCIGMVVVDPEHRKQGIGRALLDDASAFADSERHALLLLDGIGGFYEQFGYADVFDATWHELSRATLLELEAGPYRVREGGLDDADLLLDLYRRHFGTFDRTIEEQRWRLQPGGGMPLLAVDPAGQVRGYMLPPRGEHKERVGEVAVDDWPAAQALLHWHAAASDAEHIRWAIPTRAPLLYWLIDRFRMRSSRMNTPNGDWMAKVGHLPALVESLSLPPALAELEMRRLVQGLFGFREVDGLPRSSEFWVPASDSF
jgi:predicted N-acetyltransferase YhbS